MVTPVTATRFVVNEGAETETPCVGTSSVSSAWSSRQDGERVLDPVMQLSDVGVFYGSYHAVRDVTLPIGRQ